MVLLFIGSCKKELLTNEAPNGELLHKAQLFYNQHSNTSTGLKDIKLATTTAIAGNRQKIAKFPPLWDKATTARTATGVSVISVPLAKFKLSNNELDYERRVVFEEEDGEVTGGRITEVFAAPAAIKADGSALAIGSADPKSTGFSGSIIDYDLAYKQPRGRLYKNGQQAKGEVSVLPMPKGGFKALQPLGNKRSGSAKGGQSIAMGPENAISGFEPEFEDGDKNCDDIYLAYIEKDEYGNITFVEVLQFLYRICTGGPVGQQPPGGTSILVDCAEVVNGTAYINTDCQTCMGGTTEITACPPSIEVKQDSLLKYYPCMVKEILNKLLNNNTYGKLIQPFQNIKLPNGNTINIPNLPKLTFDFSSQPYGGTSNSYKLGETGSAGYSSKIEFNSAAMNNASQLFLQMAAIHETSHAYSTYYIKMGSYGMPIDTTKYSTWAMNIVNFESAAKSQLSNGNFTDHSLFLENYVDNFIRILKELNGTNYTDKQYQMAAIYGLNNAGDAPINPLISGINTYNIYKGILDKSYNNLMAKFGISPAQRDAFYLANLVNVPGNKKLPTNCP